MSHGLKLLLIAAGAIVTCIVVVVGFQLTKSGKNDTNKASEQYTSVMSGYDEVQLTCYEDQTVSGSEVVSFIKDNASSLINSQIEQIIVNTNSGKQTYNVSSAVPSPTPASGIGSQNYTTVEMLKSTVNKFQEYTTANCYINPTGKFLCTIKRNDNNMITIITFDQD